MVCCYYTSMIKENQQTELLLVPQPPSQQIMTSKERNLQIPVTFGTGEEKLLEILDDKLKNELFMTRSGWFKQKIREEFLQ